MDTQNPQSKLGRRRFLQSVAAGAGTMLLAACGSAANTPTEPTAGSAAAPTSAPAATAAPAAATAAPVAATAAASGNATAGRIAAKLDGVPDAYTEAPAPFKSVSEVPGRGGTVKVFGMLYGSAPTAHNENQYWQELEKRLGVTWEYTPAPADAFTEKASALIASGDLPDLFYLNQYAMPQTYQFIDQGAFADLTPYLSGDAIKEYPNLAAYPSFVWRSATVKGKIYGVPKWAGGRAPNTPFFRKDWADKLGKSAQPKNADEVYDLLVSFSKGDPNGNGQADTWGLSGQDWDQSFIPQMFRVPNTWRLNADGTLTHAVETEEYKQAIGFMRRLWEGGAYHPDTATLEWGQAFELFTPGSKLGLFIAGFSTFFGKGGIRYGMKNELGADVAAFIPPGHDGGKAATYPGGGTWGFTAIPATVGKDPERVKELLRVMNYLAAPAFSEESIFLDNGLEGVHHTVEADGSRKWTEKGGADMSGLTYFARPEGTYFYYPGVSGDAEYAQQVSEELLAMGIDNPVEGLYSPTDVAKTSELRQLERDRRTAIVMGREPLTALDSFIQEWRSRGGDQIRQEYEQALKASA